MQHFQAQSYSDPGMKPGKHLGVCICGVCIWGFVFGGLYFSFVFGGLYFEGLNLGGFVFRGFGFGDSIKFEHNFTTFFGYFNMNGFIGGLEHGQPTLNMPMH